MPKYLVQLTYTESGSDVLEPDLAARYRKMAVALEHQLTYPRPDRSPPEPDRDGYEF